MTRREIKVSYCVTHADIAGAGNSVCDFAVSLCALGTPDLDCDLRPLFYEGAVTRIRIIGGPWPERIGCEGVIVEAPKGYDRYPFHKLPASEVAVLLDDDPLSCEKRGCDHSPDRYLSCTLPNPDEDGEAWTCSIGREDVEAL